MQHVKGATNDRAQTATSQAAHALPAKPAGVLGVVQGFRCRVVGVSGWGLFLFKG